jgi:hypothetical protein
MQDGNRTLEIGSSVKHEWEELPVTMFVYRIPVGLR